jgi:ubiquinone/menaquinone biosynthesis C-methylase UbiE
MFANALGYEELMGRWSVRLGSLFLDFAQVKAARRLLDVGCGTGSLVLSILDRLPGCQISGIDPGAQFIEFARSRIPNANAKFDVGDALSLPYPDAAFDASLSLLVFMFLKDPAKAASEMRRVTRSGGTAAACTWDRHALELTEIFWQEATRLDPAAEAKALRPNHSNRKGQLHALWGSAGFRNVHEAALEMKLPFKSFDDFWLPHTKGVAPQGQYVASLNAEAREALRAGLRKRLLGEGPDAPFELNAVAWAVRGVVP